LGKAKPSQLELFVYEYRKPVLYFLRFFVFIVSILSIGTFVYYHGFVHSQEVKDHLLNINRFIFLFFVFNYLVRLLFNLQRQAFLRNTWIEALLLSIIFYDIVNEYFCGYKLLERGVNYLQLNHFVSFYTSLIQLYLLYLVSKEFVKGVSRNFSHIKLRPASLFITAYILMILVGSVMLMFPGLNKQGLMLNYTDSLFTSISASCVCGLQVQDVATFFNLKGQIMIMMLIQFGGIGILSFATFFASFIRKGMSLKHQSVLQSVFDAESPEGSSFQWKQVILVTLVIETVSALMLFLLWNKQVQWNSLAQHLFYSVFHAISGFCNAGFSLFPGNFTNPLVSQLYILHIGVAIVVFFGSLGFPATRDIFSVRNLRSRVSLPWKQWKMSTQIALNTSLLFIAGGTILFYFFESDGLLQGQRTMEGIITSLFQVVNARTGGFHTVYLAHAGLPTLLILCMIMFIGANSGGTGGGIKTSTFVVITRAAFAGMRNRKAITLGKRNISQHVLLKALTIYIVASVVIFISVVVLQVAEPDTPFLDLLFEDVSAFSNVGYTTGITPTLTEASKIVLMLNMFAGRVGILSIAYALSARKDETNYRYPDTHIMIG
jgi:trk system potassium uptake protein TrkH